MSIDNSEIRGVQRGIAKIPPCEKFFEVPPIPPIGSTYLAHVWVRSYMFTVSNLEGGTQDKISDFGLRTRGYIGQKCSDSGLILVVLPYD